MNHQRPFKTMAVIVFLLSAFCLLPSAFSQSSTATLSGTVQDQNGAVVPAAAVTIHNRATSLERHATTNDSGSFTIPLLPPGEYTVLVEREGFTRVQLTNIVLNVGDQKAVSVQLKVGDIASTVEVRPDASLVRTDGSVGTTVDRQFVSNLPLNGRSFQSLILLTPGVTVATSNLGDDAGQFSVNGQRASSNYFTVDGVSGNIGIYVNQISTGVIADATITALAGASPGLSALGSTSNLVSIDALEEFKIQTSTYSAEFGRQPGGQVQLVTRSGGNQFHGTLFEYLRNEALDARNYFNKKPARETPLRQNQFGGTFSGPVMLPRLGEGGGTYWSGRNRTFFFFSYEGQRLRLPTIGVLIVPSLRLRQAAAPALRPVLGASPIPNGPELLNTAGQPIGLAPYSVGVSNASTLDATGIRIDHAVNGKLTLFGRYNESPSDTAIGASNKSRTLVSTRTLTLGATSVVSPKLSNEFRFNYSRQRALNDRPQIELGGSVPVDPNLLTSGYGGLANVFYNLGGISPSFFAGKFADSYQRQINVVDNLSMLRGAHQFKVGIDYRRLAPIYAALDQQNSTFLGEAAIVNGIISSLSITTFQPARPQFDNFSAYAQDTWRMTSRLTLDLGVRWELNPPPTEAEGRMPPLAVGITGTDVSKATLAPPGTPFYKTVYTAFAPRIGVAYHLNQTSGRESVLRGGFGVYYDLGSSRAAGAWPFSANRTLSNVPFPAPATLATRPNIVLVTTLPTTNQVFSHDQNLKLPFTLQWNFAVEQALGTQQAMSLSYVASAGRKLLTTQNLNLPAGFTSGPRPNPNFATIQYTLNSPTSDYHSLQAQYRARLRRRLQALVNYTWSHAIDEASTDGPRLVLERGNANFDVRHNLSAALNYDLPALNAGLVLRTVTRNWSVDTIVHAQSGRPVNVTGNTTIIDGLSLSVRPDLISGVPLYITDPAVPGGRRLNAAAFKAVPLNPAFPAVAARQGTFGRNVLKDLPLYQVDVAVGRRFKFSEQWILQLKGEAFNVFNHPMFSMFGATNFTVPSTFGVPTQTLSVRLGGFNSIYQLGGARSIQLSLRLSF